MKSKNQTEMEIGYEIRNGSLVGKQAPNFSTWSSLGRSSITACEANDLLSNARRPVIDEILKVKGASMDTHQKSSNPQLDSRTDESYPQTSSNMKKLRPQ